MNTYTIYFTAFGRKLKKTVVAPTQEQAVQELKASISILKVAKASSSNPITDFLNLFKK